MDISKKKVLFTDLDGTLIRTVSGKTFPEDITDFRLRKDVVDAINRLPNINLIAVVTNQGGIPQYVSQTDFEAKINAICFFLQGITHRFTVYEYCASMDKEDQMRKPNTGMLAEIDKTFCIGVDYSEMLMIGDASGKPGDFSDSDRKTAENFHIDYMDVEEFVKVGNPSDKA